MEGKTPWFPDFVSAVELARRQSRPVGLADPVQRYFNTLETGRTHELEEERSSDGLLAAVRIYDDVEAPV